MKEESLQIAENTQDWIELKSVLQGVGIFFLYLFSTFATGILGAISCVNTIEIYTGYHFGYNAVKPCSSLWFYLGGSMVMHISFQVLNFCASKFEGKRMGQIIPFLFGFFCPGVIPLVPFAIPFILVYIFWKYSCRTSK